MGVWVTGDIHGNPIRSNTESFYEQKEFPKDKNKNIVIILGDFGIVWDREESKNEKYWLDWLESKPFTTVFIDGNHENLTRLMSFPVKEWHGEKVHEIRPHVLHLMRGEVFTIESKKFFAFGGASSHDVSDGILDYDDENWREKAKELDRCGKYMYRIKGLTWWEEELPTKKETENGLKNLKKANNQVDYILSHSPSTSELFLMGGKGLYQPDHLTDYLDDVMAVSKYNKHLFAHMHVNQEINSQHICLYEQIVRIL